MLSKMFITRVHAVAFTLFFFFFFIIHFLSLRRVKCDLIFIKKGNINFEENLLTSLQVTEVV